MVRIQWRTIQKALNDLYNHDDVVIHLEPDILECEVKRALISSTKNKASGGGRILAELFQILKDDVKVLHSMRQQIWKTQQWPQDWERSISSQSQRRARPENVQTITQLHSFHMLIRQCLKSFKLGYGSTWTENFQMYKLDLEKSRETRDEVANIHWIIEKVRNFREIPTSASLTTTNCRIFLKR